MVKNTAGAKIGSQMVSATDGSAFTGAVTVYVTGDAGTQAAGSVGSGACTHEGNGYHTYAPAQAETNYTVIAFTFIGTGAVPSTVQVFTTGWDPTAAVVPANATQIGGQTASASGTVTFPNATLASTTNITAGTIATATNVTTVNGLAAGVITAASIAADAITDAKVASDVTIASVTGAVGSVTGAVGSVTGAVGSVTGAVGSVTGNVGGNVVGSVASVTAGVTLAASAVQAIWDALTSALTTVGSIGKKLADWTIGTAQTGDAFARLGAPAGASVSADVAAVKVDTAAILVDTGTTLDGRIPAALVSGRMDASVGAMAANVVTAAAIATDAIGSDELAATAITEIQAGLSTLDAAGVRTAVGLASANLDTQLSTIDDFLDTEIAAILAAVDTEVGAIKTVTDQLVAAQSEPSAVPAANATPLAKIAWLAALARNKVKQSTTTQTLVADDGSTTIATAAVSDSGTEFVRAEWV